jgi:nitrogenase molybdenum-iron protein alpha chain
MNYLNDKAPPVREDRLKACSAFGGSACSLVKGSKIGCLAKTKRGFVQGSGCQLSLSLASLNSVQDAVIVLHAPLGCGTGSSMVASGIVKVNQANRGQPRRGTTWVSTNLGEADVISGGEQKLRETIIDVDKRLRPKVIFVVAGCVPAIIGDDIDLVARELKGKVAARICLLHCEGFKTTIQATAYDAVYHSILRGLFDIDEFEEEIVPVVRSPEFEAREAAYQYRRKRTVNLLNVSSMSFVDEQELIRLLSALGLYTQVYPCYSNPDDYVKATEAALSVSICPTHDDYFLKHLEELYGVPAYIGTIPIGFSNTRKWLLGVAAHFGLEKEAERLIAAEEAEARAAIAPYAEKLKGKTAFVCAGEFRAAATGILFEEDYGMKLLGVRSFHYDSFADEIFSELPRPEETVINVGPWQPSEQANLIHKLKPDLFVGHVGTNGWASKEGFPVIPIFSPAYSYMGYRGVFDMATRLERTLRNTAFNQTVSKAVKPPYKQSWYADDPFRYIKQDDALAQIAASAPGA